MLSVITLWRVLLEYYEYATSCGLSWKAGSIIMDIHEVSSRLHGDCSPRCVKKCQNRREMLEL